MKKLACLLLALMLAGCAALPASGKFIKWVEFNVPYEMLAQALDYDVSSHGTECQLDFIELLAYCGALRGGNFPNRRSKDMDELAARLRGGEKLRNIVGGMEYYAYYKRVYTAVLAEFVGEYEKEDGSVGYGLKVFSPIAAGHWYSHYDDFGAARTYGYRRRHLGNDLMGSVGTPIVAIEGGTVEALGWNQYGGWRVGIRSADGQRYYYYAHLRKDAPYAAGLSEGDRVEAGEVIGYLGMTGYSTRENVNNINVPHLHFGMQLIFDESQKEGNAEIWIDVYEIVKLLSVNRRTVSADNIAEN